MIVLFCVLVYLSCFRETDKDISMVKSGKEVFFIGQTVVKIKSLKQQINKVNFTYLSVSPLSMSISLYLSLSLVLCPCTPGIY